ncbi:MAG TPA: trypsin-like peptidase domain-containing protein, partial [Burkholderiales bacterium]|nr:trypsin-like peptidase domain-containing protein [Burkholderiales bacterium]
MALAFGAWWFGFWDKTPSKTDAVPVEQRAVIARGSLAEDEQNNIAVFKAASVSTVNITTLETQRGFLSLNVSQVPKGTGTGFIWDDQGHIVTNFHVIQGGSGAIVTLSDQTTWKAALVGAFPDRDLAVLRIDAPKEKMRPLAVGTSKDLQVGQKVYAIGNPFGLDQTLTTGIVSALNREIESVTQRTIRGVIQTDAAINPGNSGGPLLDSAGRLIGVNAAIYSPSGASAGIGFAIPVDEVNRIVPRVIHDGKFIRPALGIHAAPPQLLSALGSPKGVAVVGVTRHSAAEAAGIKPFRRGPAGEIIAGDIITAL